MSLDGIFRTAKHVLDCQILIYKFEEIMYSFSYFLQEDQAVSEDKKLWDTSENAVRIQIYAAIIAYCMMALCRRR